MQKKIFKKYIYIYYLLKASQCRQKSLIHKRYNNISIFLIRFYNSINNTNNIFIIKKFLSDNLVYN